MGFEIPAVCHGPLVVKAVSLCCPGSIWLWSARAVGRSVGCGICGAFCCGVWDGGWECVGWGWVCASVSVSGCVCVCLCLSVCVRGLGGWLWGVKMGSRVVLRACLPELFGAAMAPASMVARAPGSKGLPTRSSQTSTLPMCAGPRRADNASCIAHLWLAPCDDEEAFGTPL